jgi:hypothetical protein
VRPNSEGPGRGGTGRHVRRRTHLAGLAAALVTAVLLAAGSSAGGSSTSSGSSSAPAATASAAASSGAASGTQAASPAGTAPGSDIGLTASTIRVGLIADVNTSLVPGLFQDSVNAVKANGADR